MSRKLVKIFGRLWLPNVFLAFFLIVGLSLLFYSHSLFEIKSLRCFTQYGPCQNYEEKFSKFLGKNIFLLKDEDLKSVLRSEKQIKSFSIKKRIPGTLVINLVVRKARVLGNSGDKSFLLDTEGEVIGEAQNSSLLPKLSMRSDALHSDIVWAVKVLSLLNQIGFFSNGVLSANDLDVKIGELEVKMPKNKDPVILAGSLQFMLKRFTMEGRIPVKIDLRFKNPIVKF